MPLSLYPSLARRTDWRSPARTDRRSPALSRSLLGWDEREPVPLPAPGYDPGDADGLRDLWTREPETTTRRAAAQGLTGPVGWREANARGDVARVEVLLGHLGYKDLGRTEGPTGYFGSPQHAAIRNFQKDHGLTTDGIVLPGGPTWSTLVGRTRLPDLAERSDPGSGNEPSPPGDPEGGGDGNGDDDGDQRPEPPPPVPPHKPTPPEENPPDRQDCSDLRWEIFELWQQHDDVNAALRHAEREREAILREIADLDRNPSSDPSFVIPGFPGGGRRRGRGPLIDGILGILEEMTKSGERDALRAERARLQAELQALEAEIERLRAELAALKDAIDAAVDAYEACREDGGESKRAGSGPGVPNADIRATSRGYRPRSLLMEP